MESEGSKCFVVSNSPLIVLFALFFLLSHFSIRLLFKISPETIGKKVRKKMKKNKKKN